MNTLTVDIAIVVGDRLALIRRTKPPFEDKWVLPGGHIESGETEMHAAVRELSEETGLIVSPEDLKPLCILDSPGRDPRGQKISVVFYTRISREEWSRAKAGSDAKEIKLHCLDEIDLKEIGFDHAVAIKALRRLP